MNNIFSSTRVLKLFPVLSLTLLSLLIGRSVADEGQLTDEQEAKLDILPIVFSQEDLEGETTTQMNQTPTMTGEPSSLYSDGGNYGSGDYTQGGSSHMPQEQRQTTTGGPSTSYFDQTQHNPDDDEYQLDYYEEE